MRGLSRQNGKSRCFVPQHDKPVPRLLADERYDGFLQVVIADVAVTYYAFLIEHVDVRPVVDVPLSCERAGCGAVYDLTPGDALLFEDLLKRLTASVAIDSDECEGFVLQLCDHGLLMRNHCAAGASPESPEVQDDDLSPII